MSAKENLTGRSRGDFLYRFTEIFLSGRHTRIELLLAEIEIKHMHSLVDTDIKTLGCIFFLAAFKDIKCTVHIVPERFGFPVDYAELCGIEGIFHISAARHCGVTETARVNGIFDLNIKYLTCFEGLIEKDFRSVYPARICA